MTPGRARVVLEDAEVGERVAAVLDVAGLERVDGDGAALTVCSESSLDRVGPTDAPVIVLCSRTGRKAALELVAARRLRYLVPVDERLEDSLLTTIGKLIGADLFGLDRYVRHGGLSRVWSVEDSLVKAATLREIGAWAQRLGCAQLIADLFLSAIDEMAINALERQLRHGLGPVEIIAAAEVGRFAVAVRDRLGELRPEHVLGSLVRGSGPAGPAAPLDPTQAQLGFRIMFDTLSALAINIEPGKRTELIGVIDLGKSLREYRNTVPTFGCFVRASAP